MLYRLVIGEDQVYYDRRDDIMNHLDDCEVIYISAESQESAERIVEHYLNDNYINVEYDLSPMEGIIIGDFSIDTSYTN